MKHLNDKTIQNLIDNELPENDRKTMEMHLDECPSCRQRVEAQRAFSEKMKKSLETLVPDEIAVPEFSFRRTARPEMNVTRIALISSPVCGLRQQVCNRLTRLPISSMR